MDTKAIFLVGFAATAAQFLATRNFEPFTGTAAFAVAIGFGIAVFNLAAYEDLKPRETLDTYARAWKGATLGALAGTRVGFFEKNNYLHERKTKLWTVALAAVAAGICLSTVSFVLHTGGHDKRTEPGEPVPASSSTPTSSAPSLSEPFPS